MNLLALDISSTNIGVAIWLDDELTELRSVPLTGDPLERYGRAGALMAGLATYVTWDALAIEGPAYHSQPGSIIAQQRAAGAILYVWRSHFPDAPLIEVPPATAKKTLTGSGRADNTQMIACARQELPNHHVTEHSAAAYAVGLSALPQLRLEART